MKLYVKRDGEVITVFDPNFRDYFYVLSDKPERTAKAIKKVEADRRGKDVKAKSTEIVEMKRLGEDKKVVKVIVESPLDITPLRKEIWDFPHVEDIFDYDIPPARKYLIDHELVSMGTIELEGEFREGKQGKELIATKPPEPAEEEIDEELRIMSFDIESYNPDGDPRPEEDPIIMLSIADNQGFEKVLTWKDFDSDLEFVEEVEDERALLKRFMQIVEGRDFDVVTGYNTDLFDFPYLSDRADELNIDLELGRDDAEITSRRRRFETVTRVPGRPHIDIYALVDFLSRIGAIRLIDYTLENVYEHMLDKKKPDFEASEISDVWDEEGVEAIKLLEYSLSDSKATLELTEEIFPLVIELSKTVKQSIFDVSRMTPGQLVEWLLVFNAHQIDELVPGRPVGKEYEKRQRTSYVGGYVKEPEKGLHEDLVVLDFRSLYPTIIVTHNIDPATINCDCCDSEEVVSVPNLDYEFCQNRQGFIPRTLRGLIEERSDLKRKMEDLEEDSREYKSIDNRQWALKIIANSFYGMLGYPRARWYSKECAESVTSFGRYYIKRTIEMAEEEGFDVVYGDTDSVLCKLGDKSKRDVEDFLEKVNEDMPGIMELELEDYHQRGVFISKKRYALFSEDNKMEVKGLEFVRRDWAALAKDTQKRVLKAILKDGSPERAAEIVQEVTRDVRKGNVDLEDLIIHTQLKKPIEEYKSEGPHVAAARRLRKEGEEVEPGMTITYIVEKSSGNVSDCAIPVSQFGDRDYDPEYYINNQILPAVMRVMEVLGYTEEDLRYEETKQTKLGTFG